MVAEDMTIQDARSSAAMILNQMSYNTLVPAPGKLVINTPD